MLIAVLATAGAIVALASLVWVFSLKRKLTTVSEAHWALHYEFARLRARVAKLDGGATADTKDGESGS